MKWEEFQPYHRQVIDVTFGRDSQVTLRYEQHKENLRAKGQSISDYIREHVFNSSTDDARLTLNDFPYSIEGIEHWVFWVNPLSKLSEEEIELLLDQELDSRGYSKEDYIYFRNVVSRQSVPGVKHYQVFIRKSLL